MRTDIGKYSWCNSGDGTGFHLLQGTFDIASYETLEEAQQTLAQILWLEETYSPPRKAQET